MVEGYPAPEQLKMCRRGAEWAAVAAAASQIGLFEALAESPLPESALRDRLEVDARALTIVLGVLEALSLVERVDGVVSLTSEGRSRYADPSADAYEGVAARRWRDSMRQWLRLDEFLRRGGPVEQSESSEEDDEDSIARFMAAMAGKPSARVERLVEVCLERRSEARTVLDLGGGPGVHSRAFIERGLRATLFDTPDTIAHVAEAYGLSELDGLELRSGDFLESLPEGSFDIVLMANITHIYDATTNAALIRRVGDLQNDGDLLAIQDFVRGRSPFAPLFAITMLLHTEAGGTYDMDDYGAWLAAAGYSDARVDDLDTDRQLVTGLKGR